MTGSFTLAEVLRTHDLPGLHLVRFDDGKWAARDENDVWRSHPHDTPMAALQQAISGPHENSLADLDQPALFGGAPA